MIRHTPPVVLDEGYGESSEAVRRQRARAREDRHREFLNSRIRRALDCYSCDQLGSCSHRSCRRYKDDRANARANDAIRSIVGPTG